MRLTRFTLLRHAAQHKTSTMTHPCRRKRKKNEQKERKRGKSALNINKGGMGRIVFLIKTKREKNIYFFFTRMRKTSEECDVN
jgi:hypothetical protein